MVDTKSFPEAIMVFWKNIKCYLFVSSSEKVTIKIGSHEIANTKLEKLLGVDLDSQLSFDYIRGLQ